MDRQSAVRSAQKAASGFPFALGFKLVLGWREQQGQGQLPAPKGDLYEALRSSGFDYFEFSVGPCQAPAEVALLMREAAACRGAGLFIALHPYLGLPHNPAFFGERPEPLAALESVLAAAGSAGQPGRPVRVVLHPAELSYGDGAADLPALRRGLLERSRGFFAAAVERLAGSPSGVRVVVEHQVPPAPREAVIRIGDTYAELLEVVAAVDLGLCWDTGHYLLSVQRRGQDPLPPDAFLRRVELVHLHDVTSAQWDHQVIRRGSAPLRRYVQLLCQAGFNGGVTLEYSAEAIRSAGSFERVIADSLDALSAWLR